MSRQRLYLKFRIRTFIAGIVQSLRVRAGPHKRV